MNANEICQRIGKTLFTVSLAAAGFMAGCQSMEINPAPLTAAIVTAGERHGYSPGALTSGRRVFVTECTSCHRPKPVGQFTLPQWHKILDKMSPRAKLTETEKADLLAYITAARETL